jgi:hypothetical protein
VSGFVSMKMQRLVNCTNLRRQGCSLVRKQVVGYVVASADVEGLPCPLPCNMTAKHKRSINGAGVTL